MKNKYISYFIFIICLFIFNMNFCYATIYRVKINGSGVNLRSGPGTNYNTLKSISKDSEYTMVNNTLYPSEQECTNGWYKIYYEGAASGYVCSDYVTTSTILINETPTTECEQKMKDLGFPASYWPDLCSLKTKHPTWEFTPIFTGLDWSESVNNESACGISYIASSVETNIDRTCKNQYTSTWYPASSSAVAYYMDPRNWLSEKYIFQFEYLKYDNSLSNLYSGAATSVIGGTEFYSYHLNIGNDLGNIINTAGIDTNVSPIFIASRILQELGNSNKLYNLYSGIYSELDGIYYGYYNFYNFGVTDSCATTDGPSVCGLRYAYDRNWNSLYNAIKGGASQIAESYIAKGQYTGYLQRYNVVPIDSTKLYNHQYMTNVAAPSSESKTTYNTYKDLGLLDGVFAFYIPVYNNMDNTSYNENSGAIDIPSDNSSTNLNISTIITSSGYKYSSSYLTGVKQNTNVNTLKNTIESISGSGSVTILNQNGTLVNDGLIGTGYSVKIKSSSAEETLTVIINGDTSGDGVINALDLLQVQKSILGTYTLSGVYQLAGDTSDDGTINALDLLQVQKSILGTYVITQ